MDLLGGLCGTLFASLLGAQEAPQASGGGGGAGALSVRVVRGADEEEEIALILALLHLD